MTAEQPVLRVVSGEPTPAELAALVAVLSARGAAQPGRPPARSAWTDRARQVRRSPHPGPRAWLWSGRPN